MFFLCVCVWLLLVSVFLISLARQIWNEKTSVQRKKRNKKKKKKKKRVGLVSFYLLNGRKRLTGHTFSFFIFHISFFCLLCLLCLLLFVLHFVCFLIVFFGCVWDVLFYLSNVFVIGEFMDQLSTCNI